MDKFLKCRLIVTVTILSFISIKYVSVHFEIHTVVAVYRIYSKEKLLFIFFKALKRIHIYCTQYFQCTPLSCNQYVVNDIYLNSLAKLMLKKDIGIWKQLFNSTLGSLNASKNFAD